MVDTIKNGGEKMNNEFNNFDRSKDVMTTGEWVVTLLLLGIPCVNIIMLFEWAFGNWNENRKNYCRATLIWMLVGIGISLILTFMGVLSASSLMQ